MNHIDEDTRLRKKPGALILLNNGDVFEDVAEAANFSGVSRHEIMRAIYAGTEVGVGLQWNYADRTIQRMIEAQRRS